MSLEQAVKENTAAVLALTAALGHQALAAAPATAKTEKSAPKTDTPAPAADKKLVYADVGGPINAFVKAYGVEKARAIIKPWGITKLTESKEEDWPAILAAVNAAEAIEAAAAKAAA
jgi:hypothetical protein